MSDIVCDEETVLHLNLVSHTKSNFFVIQCVPFSKNLLNHYSLKGNWKLQKKIMFAQLSLCEKFSYSEFFWSVFSIQTDYLSVFSLNVGKYGPEKLRITTLFTQCFIL